MLHWVSLDSPVLLWWSVQVNGICCSVTACNKVWARLCFYTCLWFCSQGATAGIPPPRSRPPGTDTPLSRNHHPRSSKCWEIRATSGRYASYWKCILVLSIKMLPIQKLGSTAWIQCIWRNSATCLILIEYNLAWKRAVGTSILSPCLHKGGGDSLYVPWCVLIFLKFCKIFSERQILWSFYGVLGRFFLLLHWNCLFKLQFLWLLNSHFLWVYMKNVQTPGKRAHPWSKEVTSNFFCTYHLN